MLLKAAGLPRCLLPCPPSPSSVRCLLGSSQDPGYLMTLWGCLCNWLPQRPWIVGQPCKTWCQAGPPPLYTLLRAMLVAFSQLPDSGNLCSSAIVASAALGFSSSSISTQAPALLLMLFHDVPALPAEVWMPALPLLHYLSGFSNHALDLVTRLRALASGGFWTAPGLGGQMASPPNGQMQAQTAPGTTWSQQNQTLSQQCHQTQASQPALQKESQGAQGCMQPFTTQTQFHTLPQQTSKAVTHRQPSVGLQNTNNTCYMNSFMQALFLTDAFVWRIYDFTLKLKAKASKIDEEDFEFGKKVVELLQKQFAKMALTKHQHTDIWDILQAFPSDYRSGEQQDVTESIRFVMNTLGGGDQDLLREVFAGQLQEKIQCRKCGKIKVREETFTDLVLPVPTAEQAKESGIVPTMQKLLEERLKCEEMDDPNNLVTCENCQTKTFAVKWSEITQPPQHLCLCLNRFTYNKQTYDFTKEKTPVKIDEGLWIGGYEYELYNTIIHSGKDAHSGHYYAIGRRSEPTPGGDCAFYTMDDSQIKEADVSLLAGNPPEKLLDDNAYVLFLRCKQAPPTPEFRIPLSLVEYVKKQDKKQWVEPNQIWRLSVSQPPFSFIFDEAPCTSHSLDLSIHLTYQRQKVFLRK